MTEDVHIVAVGARTPLGFNADSSFAAMRAGISAVGEHLFYIDKHDEPVQMALDYELKPGLDVIDRVIAMATSALEEICTKVDFNQSGLGGVTLFLALPETRPGWGEHDNQTVANRLHQLPLSITFQSIEVLPEGHAAGLTALNIASASIKNGQSEMCIILGVDSYSDFETLSWLDNNRQLANTYNRGAFFPGEGAGAVVIAATKTLSRYKLNSLAVIRRVALATETKRIKTDTLCLGEGLTECVKEAVKSLRLPEQTIDGVICDINGERYRAEEWGFVILRCAEAFVDPTDYDLPATCWGDVGAASGPLFIGLAVAASKGNWAKGSRYMIWNSSESGQRAAALLELNSTQKGEML